MQEADHSQEIEKTEEEGRKAACGLVKLAKLAISPVLGSGLAEFEVAFTNPVAHRARVEPMHVGAYRSDANRDRINGTSPSALLRRRCRRTPLGPSGRATAHRAVTAFEREDGHGAGASNRAK